MSEQSHLTTLYDLVLAMGSEVSLPPLLRSVLGRFLYQTGFPAGIICLDDSMDPDDFRVPGSAEEIELAVHATLGDPALEELRGRSFRVRSSWVADPSAYLSESDGSAELGVPGAAYPVVLRLRIPRMGVLLLLGEEGMAQDPVLTRVFEPVMGNLARQAYLAYRHDEHTRFLQRDLNRAVSGLVRFKAALDASEECVVLVDGRGDRVVDVNLGAVRLTGFGREALEGDRVSRIVPDGVMERIRAAQSVAREETSGPSDLNDRFTTEITRHDGTRVPVEMSISPVCDHEGGPGTVILVARDVTERLSHELEMEAHRHHLEEQVAQRTAELAEKMVELRRSNEELEQFAYVASHDLQEPLRMVSSFTQLLAKRYGDKLDDDGMEFIRFAVDGANRMQALIKALLRYSRVGTRGGDFVDVDMNEVADRVVRDLSLAAAEAGAEFEVGSLPVVRADPSQMGQLLQNLLGNAIRHRGEAPPRVRVWAERLDDSWRISVGDNGVGIDEKYHDRAFVIYERLHSDASRGGTGIGLAIAKKILDRHDGRIWFESELGKGTTFNFTIPAHDDGQGAHDDG